MVNSVSEQISPFKRENSMGVGVCGCKLQKLLVVYCVSVVFSITVLSVLKYTKCVVVCCGVVNVQPCFNFSDEIIKQYSNLEF